MKGGEYILFRHSLCMYKRVYLVMMSSLSADTATSLGGKDGGGVAAGPSSILIITTTALSQLERRGHQTYMNMGVGYKNHTIQLTMLMEPRSKNETDGCTAHMENNVI